jgi:hypothetical protein
LGSQQANDMKKEWVDTMFGGIDVGFNPDTALVFIF